MHTQYTRTLQFKDDQDRGDRGPGVRLGCFVPIILADYTTYTHMCTHNTHAHSRSKTTKIEVTVALEYGLAVVPIILADYTTWPPAKKDGCWWQGEVRNSL
jgi:hypothetical protein